MGFTPTAHQFLFLLLNILIVVSVHLCVGAKESQQVCNSDICKKISQRISSGIDWTVNPCDNFYEFSCGNWMRKNKIPDERTWWSPWSIARISLKKQVKSILETSYDPKMHPVPSVKHALNLYKGCLDAQKRENVGLVPLRRILAKLGGWPMIDSQWKGEGYNWESAFVYLRSRFGLNYIISMYVDVDSKNTSRRIIYLDRPGLGLGRSELQNPRENAESMKLVSAYKTYIKSSAKLLSSANTSNLQITKDINDMIRFESRLARGSAEGEDRRDHFGLYNKMSLNQLQLRYPGVRWLSILRRVFKYAKVTLTAKDEVVVQDSFYYRNLAIVLQTTSKRTIANYMGWRYVLSFSDYTNKAFTDTYFNFQKVAYGQRKPEKPWETCYALVDNYFPLSVGRLYIENYFNAQSKPAVDRLVKEVKSAFSNELDRYDWMDDFTLKKSKEKLNEMLVNVAYQNFIRNDTELEKNYRGIREVKVDNFFSAIANLDRWQVVGNLRKLRKKVSRQVSQLSGPATVNAFNYFDLNYIQFPAGVLQSPFYSFGGPASVNFGAIGKTIGHEIIHGFDDEGKQYDKEGNLRDWWTKQTEREYNDRAECFINQYDRFREPLTGLYVNGIDTQGENLADNGGVRMSYKAYKGFVKKVGQEFDPLLPGEMSQFTSDQLFYLSFASIWCENERKESMRNTIKYGSHSPSRFRVIGTVINSKEFARAFKCPLGSKMNPREKCVLF